MEPAMDPETAPSAQVMMAMILSLSDRCSQLESEVAKLNTRAVRRVHSLPIHFETPTMSIQAFLQSITPAESTVGELIAKNASDIKMFPEISGIIRTSMQSSEPPYPMRADTRVKHKIYVFAQDAWKELDQETLVQFTKHICDRLLRSIVAWKSQNKSELDTNDNLCINVNKLIITITKINYNGSFRPLKEHIYDMLREVAN